MARGKRQKPQSRSAKIALIAAAAVLAAAAIGFTAVGVSAARSNRIYPNVSVSGVKVGGMTYDEAQSAISAAGSVKLGEDMKVTVVLTDSVSVTATGEDAGFARNAADAASMALNYGRRSGFFRNTVSFIRSRFRAVDLSSDGINNFNEEGVRKRIAEAAQKADHSAVNASYKVLDKTIEIVKGTASYKTPQGDVYSFIYASLTSGKSGEITTDKFSEAKLSGTGGTDVDFEKLYSEVYVQAKNSEYDKASGGASQSVTGVSFDRETAETAYKAAAPGEKLTVELVFTEPEITTEKMKSMLFRDTLASKTTSMSSSTSNRINNITLAAGAMNGTVLNPGDTFSFNGTVGERTEAKGYKEAGAYVGGESVDQIGGGICQSSSTLYYCVLKAGLKVVDRSNHMYSVAYLPLGLDATVNWGSIDFKFKNSSDYPVKIVMSVKSRELTVTLLGTKTDSNHIDLESDLIKTIDYDEVTQEDKTLAAGETKVKTSGHKGYVADTYSLLYDGSGKLVSRTFIARSTYRKQDRVILTAPAETPPAESSGTGSSSSAASGSSSSSASGSGSSGKTSGSGKSSSGASSSSEVVSVTREQ